jgi:cell division protein FtsZ
MLELDEPVEQGAIVRVIGVGNFGLRAVGNMVGRIHKVECFGVQKDSIGPDNLQLVSLPLISNQDHHDAASLLEKLGTPDLVFIVANLDEEDGLLKDICTALHNGNIPTFLVIPEACTMERKTGSAGLEGMEKVTLDGVLILSESSMAPTYPPSWNVQDASSLQDHIFQLAIRQISDLITSHSLMGIDYADVMVTICGGMMRFGAGIACGDEGAFRAAEKASACLIKQGVELHTISSMLNSMYGSSNVMNMDDYNSVSNFIHGQINDECNYRIGVINDDSLGDNLLVSFIAVRRPSEEAVFPPWVKLYDRYDRTRHSEQSAPDSSIFDDNEEYEVPSWLRKAL